AGDEPRASILVRLRIDLPQSRGDGRDIGLRLLYRHAWFEKSIRLPAPKTTPAIEQATARLRRERIALHLPPHRYRDPDIGSRQPIRAIEFRRDADDGAGIRIEADRFADDRLRAQLIAP